MKKQIKRTIAAVLLVFMCAALFSGCVGTSTTSGGVIQVDFMYGGSVDLTTSMKALTDQFNETVGKEQNIHVNAIPKSGDLSSVYGQQLPSKSGADVVVLNDNYFKMYTKYLENLTPYLGSETLTSYYPTMINRYHYNIDNLTSNPSDPAYGIPIYNDTTMLYYNKTALEYVGVICISVPEEDLAAFNNGAPDANGKTKTDYGIADVTVPAKGYYRSGKPFVPAAGETDGISWTMPAKDEILIFNDRIPMNWDEIEDLGLLCTKTRNPDSKTTYGYYTEWWFNYGWSVGGNCVEDLSGEGNWVYSLQSDLSNYIVGEGKTYTGAYTGTVYQAGEPLDIKDVLNAPKGSVIGYETDDKTYYNYTVNGSAANARDFSAEINDGTLIEVPSTKTAFSRFVYLAGVGGLNVCPYPNAFNGVSSAQYFAGGRLALLVERTSCYSSIEKILIDDEWGVAPLPQYKVYDEPDNPNNDAVAVKGVNATHSDGYCVSLSKKSRVKDQAAVFVEWIATEGQKWLADNGYLSSRVADYDTCVENIPFPNATVVMDCASVAQAGDWWYMPERSWIDTWASPLNSSVRNGKMTLQDFLYQYISRTNSMLDAYKN